MSRMIVAVSALHLALTFGCGDDDGGMDGGADGGRSDGGRSDGAVPTDAPEPPTDAGGMDGGGDGGRIVDEGGVFDAGPIEEITVTGVIEGEDTGSGAPPIAGATVSILFPSGVLFDSATTAADGTYSVSSAAGMLMLMRVGPVTGYLGNLRAEAPSTIDYEAYLIRLPDRAGVEDVVAMSGSTYREADGLLVAGYNPVDVDAGGEGATLSGVTHDPAFVLYPGGLIVTNVLPRICMGAETPATDMCALAGRNDQVTFPNIVGSPAVVTIVDPAGGTCTERFGVAAWPVFPDTLITVNLDCTAS